MKKRLGILGVLILTICIIAGCGNNQVDTESINQKEIDDTDKEILSQVDTEATSIIDTQESEPLPLENTYITRYDEENAVTAPKFTFDYSDNWKVMQEEVTQDMESVTLINSENDAKIIYSYMSFPEDFDFGGSSVSMLRVNVTKAIDSKFVPGYVSAKDYSGMGPFMVAELKVTGELDMRVDSEFEDIDGSTSYAVLLESEIGTREDVRGLNQAEFSFYYSGHISFIGTLLEGEISDTDLQEILDILSSFKNHE